MSTYYDDGRVRLLHGDALVELAGLGDESAHCMVTSPPYYGLRDYGIDGQMGMEASPAEYVAGMVAVMGEVRRVLRKDGTAWLNLGDAYGRRKNLLGMPWRVALALDADGWTIRNAIIWHKSNAMPESVTDRLSTRYESVFLLTRSRRYWFDLDTIREPHVSPQTGRAATFDRATKEADVPGQRYRQHREGRSSLSHGKASGTSLSPTGSRHTAHHPNGKNPGDIWRVPTKPSTFAHFAVMPTALASRCITAGCPEGGIVLDPFAGAGTTALAARSLGRRSIGIDLNTEYLEIARKRLEAAA